MAVRPWSLTGNAGIDSTVDFLGTTDGQSLIIKTSGTERIQIDATGKVGIGIVDPAAQLSLGNYAGIRQLVWDGDLNGTTDDNCGFGIDLIPGIGRTFDIFMGYGTKKLNIVVPSGPWPYPGYSPLLTVLNNGNVGIGTLEPASKLHVAGDITVTGDVQLTGADCAEHFDVAGDRPPEPGTVVVIDADGGLRESRKPYDKKVAGVVSGACEYRPALILDKRIDDRNRVAVALVGKVYCKVDAQYSPIEIGDLLTTSASPGYAMKAAEPQKAFGAVIGKALRPLDRGQGLIPVLIALQ